LIYQYNLDNCQSALVRPDQVVCSKITGYTGFLRCGAAFAWIKSLMSKKLTALPESFEDAMAELAQLVAQMEAGQLPLEASVAAYARGSELIKFCAAQLDKVESQVKVLEGDMLKPFADADEAAQ
jgi:exodeoxyribonuclease VII small subunit